MKTCTKCHIEKKESQFPKDSRKRDGLSPVCKECHKVYSSKRYTEHKEEILAHSTQYRVEHPEYHKQYNTEHKEEYKGYTAKWHAKHPEQHQNRRARIEDGGGSFTLDEWTALLIKYRYTCLCCGREDVKLTVDHVVPVSLGGSNDIENIQPLCKSCNCSKGANTIDFRLNADEWAN